MDGHESHTQIRCASCSFIHKRYKSYKSFPRRPFVNDESQTERTGKKLSLGNRNGKTQTFLKYLINTFFYKTLLFLFDADAFNIQMNINYN